MSIPVVPRSSTESGYEPDATELEDGEVVSNLGDGRLFLKKANGEVVVFEPLLQTNEKTPSVAYALSVVLG
jgi:hypothetical protein